MRYHYKKPEFYASMYGKIYICDHPVYTRCTLFVIGDKGLSIIQQRYEADTKKTWWSEVDPWLTEARKREEKREAEIEEREKNTERLMMLIMQDCHATYILSEATAKAVQRIPDAKCNGDMTSALEKAESIQKKETEFLTDLGIKHIFGD